MDLLAKVIIALDEVPQTVEQLLGQTEDLLLVLRLLVLHPGDMYHVEDAKQVLLTRHEHFLLKRLAPQRGIIRQRQLQRRLEGHEHNDEVHRLTPVLDILRIILPGQLVHVLTHTLDMLLQIAFLILRRLRIHILLIRHERHLRVDDGVLPLRIVQDHVGLHLLARLVVLQRTPHLVSQPGLHLIVDALRQSLRRQQVAEDDLAHIARYLIVTPQYVRQPLGLLTQLLCLLHHQADLFTERGRVCRTLFLRLADGLLHIRDGLFQRLGDARHRLRVRLLQLRCTALQHLLRHRHKLGVALLLFLLLLVADMLQVLAHQLQLPRLSLCLGV